tara:strand:+ start:178827 stop:179441 length:615 start_codon:yes stop_codon:yes gene_type:complete
MTSNAENKQLIREHAKKTRAMLPLNGNDGDDLSRKFFEIFDRWLDATSVVAVYWPLNKECDTLPLIDDLLGKNITVALPHINGTDTGLDFYAWTQDLPLIESDFGAMHPDIAAGKYGEAIQPNIILLPMLAYDRKGARLGYGAGHYDRAIDALKAEGTDPLLVGIAYMEQICLYPLPAEDHDQPLDCVLNPNGYTRFSPRAPMG